MNYSRAYIIHGWGGSPEVNWFPWLKKELALKGMDTQVPLMPETDYPKLDKWIDKLNEVIGTADENVYLIGHSLGCMTILRYLEKNKVGKIGGIVLVSGFSNSVGIPEIENFFETPLDYEEIKKKVKKIVVINSDNDPYVPLEEGEILQDKLNAELIVMKGAYHINEGNGFFELPIGLNVLLKMMGYEK